MAPGAPIGGRAAAKVAVAFGGGRTFASEYSLGNK